MENTTPITESQIASLREVAMSLVLPVEMGGLDRLEASQVIDNLLTQIDQPVRAFEFDLEVFANDNAESLHDYWLAYCEEDQPNPQTPEEFIEGIYNTPARDKYSDLVWSVEY